MPPDRLESNKEVVGPVVLQPEDSPLALLNLAFVGKTIKEVYPIFGKDNTFQGVRLITSSKEQIVLVAAILRKELKDVDTHGTIIRRYPVLQCKKEKVNNARY